ncbi:MAG: class I SAM-dependent methyltransferase [Anaerolineales bacterium]|jgi:SAM-dependent methyltransferase
MSSHYDKEYFDWQRDQGKFGAIADRFKFDEYIQTNDAVLEFGCGGGYLLNSILAKAKMGIEISDHARRAANQSGLNVVSDISEVPDRFADVLISNHVLEHVISPHAVLSELRTKIKAGGLAVFVVPHQGPREKYQHDDINNHLYTWNPLTLGNLFASAGYDVIRVDTLRHRWPPGYWWIFNNFGLQVFHAFARIYAYLRNSFQIRIVGKSE